MAITIRVFNQSDSKYYTVTVDFASSVINAVNGVPTNIETDYYLKISTTMKFHGAAFPEYLVRTLNDVPAGYAPANFTELIQDYIDYFVTQAELGWSSSSSSDSSPSSSSRSSESSSSRSSESSSSNSSLSISSDSSLSNSSSSSSSHP